MPENTKSEAPTETRAFHRKSYAIGEMYMRKALVGSLGVLLAALPSTSASAWEQGEQSVTRFFCSVQ